MPVRTDEVAEHLRAALEASTERAEVQGCHPLTILMGELVVAAWAPWPTPERQAELRSMPYRAYLRSPEWRATRERMLAFAGHRCQLCGHEDRLQVHHNNYDSRGLEWPQDLVVLCDSCHRGHHGR